MRTRLLAAALVALFFVGCQGGTWEEFNSDEGRFSVRMPAKPSTQTQRVNTPIGPLDVHIYLVELEDIAYLASYVDYPDEMVKKTDPKTILDGARNGAISRAQGNLISEDPVEYLRFPGRRLSFDAKNGRGFGRSIMVMADNRLYQVMALGKKEGFPQGDVDMFLDSFAVWE